MVAGLALHELWISFRLLATIAAVAAAGLVAAAVRITQPLAPPRPWFAAGRQAKCEAIGRGLIVRLTHAVRANDTGAIEILGDSVAGESKGQHRVKAWIDGVGATALRPPDDQRERHRGHRRDA